MISVSGDLERSMDGLDGEIVVLRESGAVVGNKDATGGLIGRGWSVY